MRSLLTAALSIACLTGCYHYTFEHRPESVTLTSAGGIVATEQKRTVTYERSVPTYLNGFVGNGRIDTSELCDNPIRTELRVTPADVAVSAATLLIYTPHTLYVTCER